MRKAVLVAVDEYPYTLSGSVASMNDFSEGLDA